MILNYKVISFYKSMVKYRWFIFDESKEGKYGTEKKYLFKIA